MSVAACTSRGEAHSKALLFSVFMLASTAFAAINLAMPFVIINFAVADLIGVESSVPIFISPGQGRKKDADNIVARYNLVLNASFLTQAGLGCTLCFEGLVPSCTQSGLVFRPFDPSVTSTAVMVWKRFEVLSRLAEQYLVKLRLVFDACRQHNLKDSGESNDNT